MNNYSIKMNITKHTLKIIEFSLRNIYETGFNVNQIAKQLEISAGGAHKIMQELKSMEIVKIIDLKTAIYYRLNLHNPDAIDICKLILRGNKKTISPIAKVYAGEIEKFKPSELIILFGSILAKKEFNDVDALFITDKVKGVNKFCNEISKIRTKPINPLIMTFDDFVNNIKKKNKVILEIINKGIVIKGESTYMEALKNAES